MDHVKLGERPDGDPDVDRFGFVFACAFGALLFVAGFCAHILWVGGGKETDTTRTSSCPGIAGTIQRGEHYEGNKGL